MKKTPFCPFEMDRETDPKHVAGGERWFFRNDVCLDYVSVKEKSKMKNCRRQENAPGCRGAETDSWRKPMEKADYGDGRDRT